jgi:protein-tyrosine kinase
MTMNQKTPRPPAASLIERASEAYGLREAMRKLPGTPVPTSSPADPVRYASRAPAAPAVDRRPPMGAQAKVDMASLRDSGFILPGAPPSGLSEEFRLAKRQLLLQAFGGRNSEPLEKGRLMLVCSAQPNEGKTFCSVNLALSMATETDVEILLVDADVAKPEILSTLGLPGGPGLMDALVDPSIDIESLIIRTDIPGLSVLPAGRQSHHDTELLASDRTGAVIDTLVSRHPRRIVLFDSAPALAASPASVLALHVGQIVLVVRADQTTEGELNDALSILEGNAHIQLLLNGVTYAGSHRKFGYYYGFGEKS